MRSWSSGFWCLAVLALLGGCGGGGDGGDTVSVSADRSRLVQSTTPTDFGPSQAITLSLRNAPSQGVFAGVSYSTNGIESIELMPVSETEARILVTYKAGVTLADGTYADQIDIDVCRDEACKQPIEGSPIRVASNYTVSSPNAVSTNANAVSLRVNPSGSGPWQAGLDIAISGPAPATAFYLSPTHTSTFISSVVVNRTSDTSAHLDVNFQPAYTMQQGSFDTVLNIKACYDSQCRRELRGSPLQVPVTYRVISEAVPEPGLTALAVSTRTALTHDVVDAEFSQALNAVVMVSSWPRAALYVYRADTGAEAMVPLAKQPRAVSVSPDGLKAAVGHDALVSHLDLSTAGSPTAAAPRLLDVSAQVGDLVLDARGHVHVFPLIDQWVSVHSIDVATNTETLGNNPFTYAGSRAKLHPSGDKIYSADVGLSPSDIRSYDITSGTAVSIGDSPYHGDYPMCSDLWMGAGGTRIYTACGNTFRASTVAGQDMTYAGALTLSSDNLYGYRLLSVSEAPVGKEVAVLEQVWLDCQPFSTSPLNCYTHLNTYDTDFLGQTSRRSLGPVDVNGILYVQRGQFVFHRNDGQKVLISQLSGVPGSPQPTFLSIVP